MKNKLIATGVLIGALLSNSSNILAETPKVTDVPKWAEQSVNYLTAKNIFTDMPEGTFTSNEMVDRATATTIITKALGLKINQNAKPSFQDAQNHWAAPYIAAAEQAGIVRGEGNGMFNPSGKITRVAMAVMLVNAYHLQDQVKKEISTTFEDLKGHWGERFANTLIALNISKGTDNGWKPNRIITGAEVAQLVAQTDKLQNIQPSNSKIENINQSFIEKNNKRTGKVIEKGNGYLIVKQDDVTIKTNVRAKVLKNINIGDTVHIYSESFTSSNLISDDHTLYAQRSIVQKVGEPIDSNYIKFTGKVVSKDGNSLEVSNGELVMSAETSSQVSKEINIGDSVNIYTTTVMGGEIGFESAGSAVIEKLNIKIDQPSNLKIENINQSFIEKNNKRTGKVIKKGSGYLIVKQDDVTIKTNVRAKVLKNINIGDTVHIYSKSFIGSNLISDDHTLYAQRSIVQKVGEPIDSNYIKFTGKVVSKDGNSLEVSNGELVMSAETSSQVSKEINIGDPVNIYTTTVMGGMIGFESAGSAVIEKLNVKM
ncbi:S-layer homology domain-containing protein [Bacillus thuringiensis]|uniref:S-layer homology domain-containing protein n=1 Tax=Bacillus thuringiensis TaxID=1428 RepID=UPI000D587AF6|nr:S-layer homology domain-containing protein [Bacillus thuringiensis]MBD8077310.1 S-layer homology domain-containing protein [Bacillus thuringiensis]